MNIRAAQKINYVRSAWVIAVPALLVFCCVTVYMTQYLNLVNVICVLICITSQYIFEETVIVNINKYLYLFSLPPPPLSQRSESASSSVLQVMKLFTLLKR
jgi:hypothetical protein